MSHNSTLPYLLANVRMLVIVLSRCVVLSFLFSPFLVFLALLYSFVIQSNHMATRFTAPMLSFDLPKVKVCKTEK